ncbi:hypothetical protein [Catenuloplanes japonicus]|uniref:hypothetical protein n=1 Tax=Catenuloplanes japonicus TaxID=33876 RepID=UPI0012FCD891|nr:hypothetical protein [Catenuloplanes japonicus]
MTTPAEGGEPATANEPLPNAPDATPEQRAKSRAWAREVLSHRPDPAKSAEIRKQLGLRSRRTGVAAGMARLTIDIPDDLAARVAAVAGEDLSAWFSIAADQRLQIQKMLVGTEERLKAPAKPDTPEKLLAHIDKLRADILAKMNAERDDPTDSSRENRHS